MSEVTGVFLNCDMQIEKDFERCYYKQAKDDDLDFDRDASLYERGLVRISSMPTHQWGKRCLNISIQAWNSFTISVMVDIIDGANLPVFRERIYPTDSMLVYRLIFTFN